MYNCVDINFDNDEHIENINEAVNSLTKHEDDITMISGDNEEIQANKYLLSVFSPTLRLLLSTPCCTSPTLLLPDCSSSSIKHLLNIISTGLIVTIEYYRIQAKMITIA